MENNKNLNTAPEVAEKENKKAKKPKKEKLLKNEALFKKGSYSLALTAIVLVGVVLLNVLVSVLNDRFILEFDMTAEKQNSISTGNIEYIKSVEDEVDVIVCASETNFAKNLGTIAQNYYSVEYDNVAMEYFNQTLNLIKKYQSYNKKINIRFIDTQSSEFSSVTSEYGEADLEYGSIIVSAEKADGKKRVKKLSFNDIYTTQENETYASMGMGIEVYNISANKIETALTGAVAYVLSSKTTKAALLTGHSTYTLTESFQELLEDNNYVVDTIADKVITTIPEEYSLVVIPTPSSDFTAEEIKVLNAYLENDGKLEKGLMVFADATTAYIPNFYSFISEWGIEVGEGMLYETDDNYHAPDDPTTLFSLNPGTVEELADYELFVTGYNVPLEALPEGGDNNRTVASIALSMPSVAEAPKGVKAGWSGAEDAEKTSYSTIIESTQVGYAEDNTLLESKLVVFSSPFFLSSEYNESGHVQNKEVTLGIANRLSGADDTGISFVSKSITIDDYYDSITESAVNTVRILFMFIIPLAVIAAGIVIFIKRRNA